jgi:hypothetical protein
VAVHVVALEDVQVSVVEPPLCSDVDAAVNAMVGAGTTVTVCDAALLPPAPEQTIEYVVLDDMLAVSWLPLAANGPLQPPDAVQAVAWVEFQVSVEVAPAASAVG